LPIPFADSDRFYLVFWPEEDSVSIVKEADIVHPFAVGDEKVNVRIGRQIFSGVVQCVASLAEVREAEEEFLKAHTVKQSVPARKQAENMRKDPKRPMRMEEGQSDRVCPKRARKLDTVEPVSAVT
jgi:hypothetical protein